MTIDVRAPNGAIIRFPDGTDQNTISSAMQSIVGGEQPKQQAEPVGTMEDVAKGAGSGLVEGAFGMGGMIGDTVDLTRSVGGWLGNKARQLAGKNPIEGPAPDPAGLSSIPGTQDLMASAGFQPYEPQTRAGKFARTAGSFVPAAATFSAAGGLKNAATGAVKYGLVPGLTSEAAGQATEGTALEPWARVGGALGGAALAGGASAAARWARTPKDPAIQPIMDKADALRRAADRAYDFVDQSGIQVKQQSVANGVNRIKAALQRQGYQPGLAPGETERAIKILDNLAQGPATFSRLDAARKAIKEAFTFNKPAEARLAGIMTKEFDDFVKLIGTNDVVTGANPSATSRALTQARSIWGRSTVLSDKAQIIDNIWQSSLDKVGANYTKAGLMTALRQEFRALNRKIRTNKDIGRLFTQAERDQITAVVRGSDTENLLRNIGKLAPTSPSSAAVANAALAPFTAGAGFLAGGPVGAAVGAGVPAAVGVGVGIPARVGSNILQRREIDKLVSTILNEGVPKRLPPPSSLNAPMIGFYGAQGLTPRPSAP